MKRESNAEPAGKRPLGRLWLLPLLALALLGGWFLLRSEQASLPPPAQAGNRPPNAPPEQARPRPLPKLQLTPATATDAPRSAPGSFEGKVVSRSTGEGIEGAELTFERQGSALTAHTGQGGRFRFQPPGQGTFRLGAITAPGYLPFAPEWGHSPIALTGAQGQTITGLLFQLVPSVEYQGQVLDPAGKPVGGAQVRLVGADEGELELMPLADHFTSDQSGAFRFRAPDEALLEAAHPDFSPGRARLDFSAQVSHQLSIKLRPKTAGGEQPQHVSGKVVDSRGNAIAGALITAQPSESTGAELRVEPRGRSGPDGEFELSGLDPVSYDLIASFSTLAPASATRIAPGTRGLLLTLATGARVRGKVLGAEDEPIPAFTVALFARRGPLSRELVKAVSVVDASGAYLFEGVLPGAYALVAASYGFAPSPETLLEVQASSDASADFRLSRGGRLHGRVFDAVSRRPLAGAVLSVESALQGAGSALPLLSSASTGPGGGFEMTGLAPGRTSIVVAARGHHGRILSGLEVREGEGLGPLEIDLSPLKPGEEPRLELAGIGAVLEPKEDRLSVGEVLPGGGAAEVGLAKGDAVTKVDGVAVVELGFQGAINRIRGVEDTTVTLTVLKQNAGAPAELAVVRRRIRR